MEQRRKGRVWGVRGVRDGNGGACARQRNGRWTELVASDKVAPMDQDLSRDMGTPPGMPSSMPVLWGGCMEHQSQDTHTHICLYVHKSSHSAGLWGEHGGGGGRGSR